MAQLSVLVNGQRQLHDVADNTLLVDYLRETLGLTGTHIGCDTSQCGACRACKWCFSKGLYHAGCPG